MIEVQELTKRYGKQLAVDHISFGASGGSVVGLLGPNGAGKSTTMRMLAGYIPPSSGTAKINGYDVVRQSMLARKSTGYLPENNPLYPHMYVREYLGFMGALHGMNRKKQRIEEVIGLTGLGPESHKKLGQLSKGYRQRAGLAQALLHDPPVLILDEPTSGLDPNQLSGMRQLIRDLGREKTVILSTHIMQEVELLCKDVLIINKGKIVADDELKALTAVRSLEEVFRELTR
ncbi:ABC-2 type transport system ATP-binding protein [Anseongella ginsenosidimutans]|uniref:ABC-2 type transport system ATP-binding protein n=1 Tax=Anseongella ginsenosidimutans TaxID=496056 RepID=A0A4R3L1K7_9SPHI|nr:ATP-binding cassette domain-containing protein [Anseongella ginsenosidimutans]QEC51042.1 ATP-binding cassette domain-containing protein [Anseongella ginsenosidimutans]TCS90302.1 ABC-2 type transport system ATP-binding protein [Anseongella ginsenosidimutans]